MSQTPPPPPPLGPPQPPSPGWGGGWGATPPVAPPPWGWAPQPVQPGSGRFHAQSVGDLLDSAFGIYRRNLRLILSITVVAQLPLAVVSYLAYLLAGVPRAEATIQRLSAAGTLTQHQLSSIRGPLATVAVVVVSIALLQGLVVQPLATAAMARAVGDIYLQQPASVAGAYRAVRQRFGAVVGVALILFGLGIALLAVSLAVVIAAVAALGSVGVSVLAIVLPVALFVAVVVYTRWLFASPIVMLEGAGATAALRRSWGLVRGYTPRVFGITLLVGLITGILGAIVSALLSLATQVGDDNVRLLLTQLAALVVAVAVQPISFIVVVLLYYDLRIRKEAFDLEHLAASL